MYNNYGGVHSISDSFLPTIIYSHGNFEISGVPYPFPSEKLIENTRYVSKKKYIRFIFDQYWAMKENLITLLGMWVRLEVDCVWESTDKKYIPFSTLKYFRNHFLTLVLWELFPW